MAGPPNAFCGAREGAPVTIHTKKSRLPGHEMLYNMLQAPCNSCKVWPTQSKNTNHKTHHATNYKAVRLEGRHMESVIW